MSIADDMKKDSEEGLTEDLLTRIADEVVELNKTNEEIVDLELKLKDKKAISDDYSKNIIPELMAQAGVKSITLEDGSKVIIDHKYRASISIANQGLAFAWLRETGNDSIIKNQIIVEFGKGEDTEALALYNKLKIDNPKGLIKQKQSVHASTLKAFVKEQKQAGSDIPDEPFGIYEFDETKVKKEK